MEQSHPAQKSNADQIRIGCVIMAAGNAKRFGLNKLLESYDGKPLIAHTLDAIPRQALNSLLLVTQYPAIAELSAREGIPVCINDAPELGLSHTIHLGVQALADMDGIVFLVSDQPLLRRESIARAIQLFRAHPQHIIAMCHTECDDHHGDDCHNDPQSGDCRSGNYRRGNPCIFPRTTYPELLALSGDHGGRSVLERHEEMVVYCEVEDARELWDVDTPVALWALRTGAAEAPE